MVNFVWDVSICGHGARLKFQRVLIISIIPQKESFYDTIKEISIEKKKYNINLISISE